MSCHKKSGKDGHDGHDGEHGKRGERGKRGHKGCQGPIGFTGVTGPTGPCCTGPTGATGTAPDCVGLFTKVFEEVCQTDDSFADIPGLCTCFNLQNPGNVFIFVSLSASLESPQPSEGGTSSAQVFYRVTMTPTGPVAGSNAGAQSAELSDPQEYIFGNSIVLDQFLAAGQYTVCVQWKVGASGQGVCIDPTLDGQHGSLLIESCAGISRCPD